MATQSKKKKSKKREVLASGDGIKDQVKEAVAISPGLVDRNPGSSHDLLNEHVETPSSADGRIQQPHQRQCEDDEHQKDSELQISAQEQVKTDDKKSKKKRKKKASASMNPHSTDVPVSESTEEEKSFTFEEQVEWCTGQLELGLHRRDATKAQKDSNERNIRTLRSLKVPMPRKRQLMRSLFGDYRSKMMTTPLPEGNSARAKGPYLNAVEREVAEGCGKFFKHKHSCTGLMSDVEGHNDCSEPFRFDFVINN